MSKQIGQWSDGIRTYTEDELAVHAELGMLSHRILNMDVPANVDKSRTIANARKMAAVHLNSLGYSTREIMRALGLQSPQSISKYLADGLSANDTAIHSDDDANTNLDGS